MIRLFLVDDEMMIRQGIRYAIHWEENGIVICGEAANGRAALRSMPTCNPDIVIADIQMPQMDGFTFLEKAREILPHIKVIILTGYSSHDYMAQAIRSGAFDYLEKPAESQEILNAVLRAKRQIHLEQEDSQRNEDLRQLLNATSNLSRAWLIQNIFTSGLLDEFCCRVGKLLDMPLGGDIRYHLMLLRPVGEAIWPILTALAEKFHTNMLRHLVSFGLVGGFMDAGLSRQEIVRRLEEIPGLNHMCVTPVLIVESIDPLRQGQEAYALASAKLEKYYLYEPGSILFLDMSEEEPAAAPLDYPAFLEQIERAALCVEKGQMEDALDICESTLDMLVAARPDNRSFFCMVQHMLFHMAHAMHRDDLLAQLSETVAAMPSVAAIRTEFHRLIQREKMSVAAESPLIQNVMAYMKKHYAEPLTVADVAGMSFLSPTYFGRLFKQELNISFKNYLTILRIQEAKRLLRDTNMRNYEIATRIGFTSYKLFALSFQKTTGMSANEYRAKCRKI